MTKREFFNRISNSKKDFIKEFFDILKRKRINYCIIGGMAVNAYAEPIISLDMDVVVVTSKLQKLLNILQKRFKVKIFEHSVNVSAPFSDIRIQIQTDPKYQEFIKNARIRSVLGYRLCVADIKDVFIGKVWAYLDKTRRESKRQKDLADIMRLIEAKPELFYLLPNKLKKQIEEKSGG